MPCIKLVSYADFKTAQMMLTEKLRKQNEKLKLKYYVSPTKRYVLLNTRDAYQVSFRWSLVRGPTEVLWNRQAACMSMTNV